jgi:hypothetical protein
MSRDHHVLLRPICKTQLTTNENKMGKGKKEKDGKTSSETGLLFEIKKQIFF